MLTTRKLAFTAAVVLAGVFVMNLAIAYLTRNSVPRRVMQYARESQSATVLALGNSLIAAGFDSSAFDAAAALAPSAGSANLGLGASDPVEHLLLLRYALAHGMHPQLIVYGFYDFQLTTPSVFTAADMIGNNAMLYYVEPLYARQFYTLSLRDSFQFRVMHGLPMFADRGAAWARVEILRRDLAQQGMAREVTNRFGRAADFSLLEADNAEDFHNQCEAAMTLPLSPAVGELFRQANEAGATIAVVEMPMRQSHRDLFYSTGCWSQYVTRIGSLLEPYHASLTDASAWIPDNSLFDDPLHLSRRGADQFSRHLASALEPQTASRERTETGSAYESGGHEQHGGAQ